MDWLLNPIRKARAQEIWFHCLHQDKHIADIRTSREKEDIYSSIPRCIVTISRHTCSLSYITPDTPWGPGLHAQKLS